MHLLGRKNTHPNVTDQYKAVSKSNLKSDWQRAPLVFKHQTHVVINYANLYTQIAGLSTCIFVYVFLANWSHLP